MYYKNFFSSGHVPVVVNASISAKTWAEGKKGIQSPTM